jgi:hypothetical protein
MPRLFPAIFTTREKWFRSVGQCFVAASSTKQVRGFCGRNQSRARVPAYTEYPLPCDWKTCAISTAIFLVGTIRKTVDFRI